jgi:molybdopterin molybdotransferase
MRRSPRDTTLVRPLSLEKAQGLLDRFTSALPSELVTIANASGRVLADDLRLEAAMPPADRAAVDGLALSARETVGASAYNPLPFRLGLGGALRAPAGQGKLVAAGDPMPAGTDAVVRLEEMPDAAAALEVIEPVAKGENVEAAGSHAPAGAIVLRRGWRVRPHELGLLASVGRKSVAVMPRPRIRIVLAGRGSPRDENGPMLQACIERDGGAVRGPPARVEGRAAIAAAICAAAADLVLVAGGSGTGLGDETAAAMREAGEVVLHGIAIAPGGTAGLARTRLGLPVLMLPGAPAACLCAYELFAGRAVRRLGGRDPGLPFPTLRTTTARKIVSSIGRTEMVPVRRRDDGAVEPTGSFAGAALFALAEADGFVIVPQSSEGCPAGAACTVYLYPERPKEHRPEA